MTDRTNKNINIRISDRWDYYCNNKMNGLDNFIKGQNDPYYRVLNEKNPDKRAKLREIIIQKSKNKSGLDDIQQNDNIRRVNYNWQINSGDSYFNYQAQTLKERRHFLRKNHKQFEAKKRKLEEKNKNVNQRRNANYAMRLNGAINDTVKLNPNVYNTSQLNSFSVACFREIENDKRIPGVYKRQVIQHGNEYAKTQNIYHREDKDGFLNYTVF